MLNRKLNILIILLLIVLIVVAYILFFRKIEVESLTLDDDEVNMIVGDNYQINVFFTPSNATDKSIKYLSSDESIITVDANGVVTALKKGAAEIKISTLDDLVSTICKIKVSNKLVTRIDLEEKNLNIIINNKKEIKYRIIPSDATVKKLKYASSDESIITVDANGVIEAIAGGSAEVIIHDEDDNAEARCNVKVRVPVEKVSINSSNITMNIGDAKTLLASVYPETATDKSVKWEIDNSEIATISEDGKVVAKKIGEAKVKVITIDGNMEAICNIKVEPYNSFGAYKHVFIIGIDGLGGTYAKVSSPNFDRIFNNYAYTHDADTEYITISAQNWGSILTGVSYDTHKYTNDSIEKNKHTSSDQYPSIFYYVYKNIPNANLLSVVHWTPINNGIIENDIGVKMAGYGSDSSVVDDVVGRINNNYIPTLMFVHFDEVDAAGHAAGGFSTKYYNAVTDSDTRMGKIYNAIEKKGLMSDSLFIVVADHGESSKGHGGRSKEEISVVLAVAGHSVKKVRLTNVRNRDVAGIALYALGIKSPSYFQSNVPQNLFGEKR